MLVRGLFWYEYGERFPSKSIIAPPQQRSEWRLMVAGSLLRGLLPIVFAGQRPHGRCRRPDKGGTALIAVRFSSLRGRQRPQTVTKTALGLRSHRSSCGS
jgi:hypothetical protein